MGNTRNPVANQLINIHNLLSVPVIGFFPIDGHIPNATTNAIKDQNTIFNISIVLLFNDLHVEL
ncbi:MAG: hypothetical protein MJ233_00580 [Mycoplasmoidaceae bacterium]|nr:hypothetical protein [Mycoplasmoidaceae bacterium]